jgi:hypothetical protein
MPSEREFLAQQAANAKARLRQTARTLSDELLAPLRIRLLVRRRPWWCLGGAGAAGFLAGLRLGRRDAKSPPNQPRNWLQRALAPVTVGARRLLRTTLGAMALGRFGQAVSPRDATTSAPPATNGHPSTAAPSEV